MTISKKIRCSNKIFVSLKTININGQNNFGICKKFHTNFFWFECKDENSPPFLGKLKNIIKKIFRVGPSKWCRKKCQGNPSRAIYSFSVSAALVWSNLVKFSVPSLRFWAVGLAFTLLFPAQGKLSDHIFSEKAPAVRHTTFNLRTAHDK